MKPRMPPPPAGYRWEIEIRLDGEYGYAGATLVPNALGRALDLRPYGFGHALIGDARTREMAYESICRGAEMTLEFDRILKEARGQRG